MGKFDGMDPKLVRDLLSEVKQASAQMREVEAQVTQLMSRAGLSSHSSHRPSRIADACDVMVRDVTGRVTLLEKKIKHEVRPPAEPQAGGPKAEDPKVDSGSHGKSDAKVDSGSHGKSDAKVDSGSHGKSDAKVDSGSHARPDSVADTRSDAKPDTGSKGDETSPRDRGSTPDAPQDNPAPRNESVSGGDPDPKGDTGSKGDERSPRGGGNTAGIEILDTWQKDHPDDIDQRGDMKPRVVAVDGVRVLQIPLDSPTAAEVTELLKKIEGIPPLDTPATGGVSDLAGLPSGQIEPAQAPTWTDSGISIPDTVEPVPDQTIQPPGTGGETDIPSTGTLPESGETRHSEATVGKSAAWWADDGTEAVSVRTASPDMDAAKTLTGNARGIEPMDMPGVWVSDGETWGEGVWTPLDIEPGGQAADVDPGDPLRPIPPPGGQPGGQ
ncbi:hypothetical protein [Streptosporangium sp. NPDC087985]|uniref:hypothetical protein n=1 Tax=Streptosporangium sp. NPDC087985 TaxID=3366196 RepID=UPI0038118257